MTAAPRPLQLWVDADACPNVIKDILFRAAERRQVICTLVANQFIPVGKAPWLKSIQVPSGFDVADDRIVELIQPGDLAITADIPLAAKVVEKGAFALNPRGTFYTAENIRQRLTMRNFMEELRSNGVQTGGPATFSQQDRTAFANALDRFLAQHLK
ncbi:MAG: YaiI/YqxD family protein [Moraxellaceae bacterium]|nr:YaiI/YqxD family protein [Moraxellaceae bacterium]